MKLQLSGLLSTVALCGTLLSSGSVMAQGTWDFGTNACNPGGTPASASCAIGTVTAGITAWGYTGSGFTQGNLGEFDPSGFGAYTGRYETGTGSNHAFDNITSGCGTTIGTGNSGLSQGNSGCGGTIEAMLLNFGSAKVNLSEVKIGFGNDADLSVYRWDGAAGGPTMGTTTATMATGALSGWTLVGSNDMDAINPFATGSNKFSSYFLITTFFGASTASLDYGNDAFKIRTITANLCTGTLSGGNGTPNGNGSSCSTVPEPTSLALVGFALLGVTAVRRRATRA